MSSENQKATYAVAKVNDVDIIVIGNSGEKRIPIAPICKALGIDKDSQIKKVLRDPILGSTTVIMTAVASDEKDREMVTIPFRYVFGWLFSIDDSRVKDEAREAVLKYKLECYNALYDHFTAFADFVEMRQQLVDKRLEELEKVRSDFNNTKSLLEEAKARLNEARSYSWERYQLDKMQLTINFEGGQNHD